MDGISDSLSNGPGGTDIVNESTNRDSLDTTHVNLLPLSEESDEEVTSEVPVQDLGHEVQVGHESSLEDDRDVGSVEQLNGVGGSLSSDLENIYRIKELYKSTLLFLMGISTLNP